MVHLADVAEIVVFANDSVHGPSRAPMQRVCRFLDEAAVSLFDVPRARLAVITVTSLWPSDHRPTLDHCKVASVFHMQRLPHHVSASPAACCDRYCDICKATVMLRLVK